MKLLASILFLLTIVSIKAQTIENKAINNFWGSKEWPSFYIQYYIPSSISGHFLESKNFIFTLGILQPNIKYQMSSRAFEKMMQSCVVGPNPFYNVVFIKLNAPDIKIYKIHVYDIYGNILYNKILNQVCIDLNWQIHIDASAGKIFVITIEYSAIPHPDIHFIKQYKLIHYE